MTQTLQLLQKGNRSQPTIYRFGVNETLCLYFDHSGTIEICDNAGRHIRSLDRYTLMRIGYSPAKLKNGEVSDQFIATRRYCIRDRLRDAARATVFAVLISAAAILVSNITGCSDYVMQQLDKDIATSTVYPAANYDAQIKFKQANEHANRFLAKQYGR